MLDDACTVVKVGGSLFDWPDLRTRLNGWLDRLDAPRVLLVPGGGQLADAVRQLDRVHQLGEEAAHWLALAAMSANARFLLDLVPRARQCDSLALRAGSVSDGFCQSVAYASGSSACQVRQSHADASGSYERIHVLDALPFFRADDEQADHLPHGWQVTSDSLAVRAAVLARARELVLLKSVDWPGGDWHAAVNAGIVDGYFVEALRQAHAGLRVCVVNLRSPLAA